MKNIGVLGQGITAKAIQSFLNTSDEYHEVPYKDADIIVTSPGIPPKSWPKVNIEIISDIEFAYRILKKEARVPTIIGITGTNGKTTVTAGIAHALNTTPYGNIGRPFVSSLNEISNTDTVVIELSSFQLFSSPSLHCDVAIIVNIDPDHLDWHGSLDHYKAAKWQIIKPSNQTLYVPQCLVGDAEKTNANLTVIESLSPPSWGQFSGQHNQLNAAIIQDVCQRLNVNKDALNEQMASFKLPPFRCESIFSNDQLTIINDSKATNMAATLAAVNSFSGDKLLILCGEPKEAYARDWLEQVAKSCHTIYAAGYLNQHQDVFPEGMHEKISFFSTLELATQAALNVTHKGTILFSPSAASFDEFDNYMDRGQAFNRYVNEAI